MTETIKVDKSDLLIELKEQAMVVHYQHSASTLGQSLATGLDWEIETLKEMLGIEDEDL